MNIRHAMEEALHRGEKFKDQLFTEVLSSDTVNGLLQNDLFLKSLTKVLNTKYEVERAVRTNIRHVLKALNVPSRDEINTMERKIHRLEHEIDGIHRKILTKRLSKGKKSTATAAKRKKSKSSSKK